MLRNPAYRGRACFGKTEVRPRQRVTRPLRQRGGVPMRNSANHERPRQEWIEIPVPALVSDATFARAQDQLEQNKRYSPRRTIEPTLLQGMLVCDRCGYALYRTSTRTSRRRLYYYRCLGADRYRHLKGAVCDTRPVRQDHLDTVVWNEILRLLDDPGLIHAEIDRRREAAQRTDPLKHREDALRRDEVRLATNIDRLVTAYQEGLLSLEQLRGRVPELRKRQHGVHAELASLTAAATGETRSLRLVETLADFRTRLRARAQTLDIADRQKILRLVVKEILVGHDTITIRHSIPVPDANPESTGRPPPPPEASPPGTGQRYLMRSSRHDPALRRAPRPLIPRTVWTLHGRTKPPRNVQPDPRDGRVMRHGALDQVMRNGLKGTSHTLPISRTCLSGSPSCAPSIPWKVDR